MFNRLWYLVIIIPCLLLIPIFYVKHTKAQAPQQQLTEIEFLKLENVAYRQQLLKIESDQLVDGICKSRGFVKCEINFQTKAITEIKK